MPKEMTENQFDMIVIGMGASGLACVVGIIKKCKIRNIPIPRILMIEKNKKPGKKLLMTGNGRCNVTHRPALLKAYHGSDVSFCQYSIDQYDHKSITDFFSELGLDIVFDEMGRGYPYTLHSGSVLDCLRFAIDDTDVQILTSTEAKQIKKNAGCFFVKTDTNDIYKSNIVVYAVGGACAPQTGSDGRSYHLAESLGHKKTDICPGIVQIKTDNSFVKKLAGLRFDALVSIYIDQKMIRSERGELLFTDYGISGPVALQLSGVASRYFNIRNSQSNIYISIDFMPDATKEMIIDIVQKRAVIFSSRPVERLFAGLFVNRLSTALIRYADDIAMSEEISQIDAYWVEKIARVIKGVEIPVLGVRGLNDAQITIGGIQTRDFSPRTMESNLQSRFFAIGEALDIDGDCGGYNLHWAWASALVAADRIVDYLEHQND